VLVVEFDRKGRSVWNELPLSGGEPFAIRPSI
jgi:hypothetical protein